jgi:hypothetical protein
MCVSTVTAGEQLRVGYIQILVCSLSCEFSFQDMPGVVAFLSAKDIPGKNSFVPVGLMGLFEDEEVCRFYRNISAVPKANGGADVEMLQWNEIFLGMLVVSDDIFSVRVKERDLGQVTETILKVS